MMAACWNSYFRKTYTLQCRRYRRVVQRRWSNIGYSERFVHSPFPHKRRDYNNSGTTCLNYNLEQLTVYHDACYEEKYLTLGLQLN